MEKLSGWRRRTIVLLILLGLVVLSTTWFASSRRTVETFPNADRILLINDAGPVRVRSVASFDGELEGSIDAAGVIIRFSQSWLTSGPRLESKAEGDSLAVRATCPGRFPCRVALEVFVPAGVQLSVVAAGDMVQVDTFDGALSVFAGEDGVALGSVAGSVNVVSDGPVSGSTLGPTEMTIDVVDDPVDLDFVDPPTLLSVSAGNRTVTIGLPESASYKIDAAGPDVAIDAESNEESERLISVRAGGSVLISTTP